MFFKQRLEPKALTLLRFLKTRMDLSAKDSNNYLYLEKGFIGEKKLDLMLEHLSSDWLIINDLLLEFNNTFFQIDTVLICHDDIYLLDVKNYEGDYYVDGERWYSVPKNEIKSPIDQLKRSESLFRRYLQSLGFTSSIKSYLIFINPEFYLYQAPLNQPIIFPTQLNRFLNKLNTNSAKLKDRHFKLGEQLAANHVKEQPFMRLPKYNFDQIKKGITCRDCFSFFLVYQDGHLVCSKCGCEEKFDSAVLRCVEEYCLLFPGRKITTIDIFEWCGKIKSRKAFRRVLNKNFKLMGTRKHTYFVKD